MSGMRIEESAEAKMYDEDRDALAAEYVLGTLSAQEREQAEALLSMDSSFAQIVRVWERRLGELNVMVEAVEPPPDVWARIKSDIEVANPNNQEAAADTDFVTSAMRSDFRSDTPIDMRPDLHTDLHTDLRPDLQTDLHPDLPAPSSLPPGTQASVDSAAEQSFATIPDLLADHAEGPSQTALVDGLASTLLAREPSSDLDRQLAGSATVGPASPTKLALLDLDHSMRRWRGAAIAAGVIAALLAIYIAAARFVPGLVASDRQSQSVLAGAAGRPAGSRLLAVLQQDPTAPAFLVMLDSQERNITVRRLTAAPDKGRSYELWLTSAKSAKPASLGLIGGAEFTSRPIPANLDLEAMQNASYSVSLEPAAGSPTGAPSGPMLFKGRMVEAAPAASR